MCKIEYFVVVRPLSIQLSGVDRPVKEGTTVTIMCKVEGSKPQADIIWYNGTSLRSKTEPSDVAVKVKKKHHMTSYIFFNPIIT